MRSIARWRRRTAQKLQQPWLRAMLYIVCVPLFPEYIAPVWGLLAFFAVWRDAQADGRSLSLGGVGKALLIYLAYQAITIPFAEMPLASLSSFMLWVFLFLAYLALVNLITDRKRLDTVLYAVTLVAGLVGLIGCVQYFLRFVGLDTPLQVWEGLDRLVYSFFPMEIDVSVKGLRVSSVFANPNLVGQYFVMVTPFAAYYALHGERLRRRRLCRFCLVAIIGCAAFTFSRGTYLSLMIIAVVLAIANIRSIVTILLSALSALLLVPETVWGRLMSVGKLDASTLERLNVWKLCIGLVSKNPLFGTGCGVQYTWSVMEANDIHAPHAHNIVLQLLVEGGIVGLCIVLFLGFRVVQSALTLVNRKESRAFGVTLIAFVIGFCTNGMVEYGLTFPKLMSTFALVLAVTDALCCLQLNHALSPLRETVTFGGRLFGRRGAEIKR